MSNIITARGLRRTYGQGHDAFEAVKGIDLDVAEGEVFALLGTWRCGGEPAATRPLPMSSRSRSISPTAPVSGWDRSPVARNADQTKATIYTYDMQLHLAEILAWARIMACDSMASKRGRPRLNRCSSTSPPTPPTTRRPPTT